MKRLISQRPGILVLPKSKLILKPKHPVLVEEITDEIRKAVDKGWVKFKDDNTESSKAKDDDNSASHDWEVDYSRVEENLVTIKDLISDRSITGEILEKKGNQHFTLKDIGTVKKNQFWPTAQAMEIIDGAE